MDRRQPSWAENAQFWKTTLTAVSLTFSILPTITFGLRVYASHLVSRKLRADDILMGCALILMWGNTASVLLKAFNGIGVPTAELPHDKQVLLNLGSWFIVKFWASSMACAKVSICLFLRHLLGCDTNMRISLDVMAVLSVCWACVPFFYTIFFCDPVAYYWDKTLDGQCVENRLYVIESIVVAIFSLVTDLAILIIPMSSIWRLQIRLKQKIGVTAILCVGGIVCVFSLLRCVQFAYFDTANLSSSSNLLSLWTMLENNFSILCGCMPQLKPLFNRIVGDNSTKPVSTGYNPTYGGRTTHPASQGFRRMSGEIDEDNSTPASRSAAEIVRNLSEIELKAFEFDTTVALDIQTPLQQASTDIDSSVSSWEGYHAQ